MYTLISSRFQKKKQHKKQKNKKPPRHSVIASRWSRKLEHFAEVAIDGSQNRCLVLTGFIIDLDR
jgi:hypothetical protein